MQQKTACQQQFQCLICNTKKQTKHKIIKIYDEMFWILQPGKLTEAFKYFLQGMGYSKSNWFIDYYAYQCIY